MRWAGAYLANGPAASDDDSKAYRNSSRYVLSEPEYLTVLSGATGKELSTIELSVPDIRVVPRQP